MKNEELNLVELLKDCPKGTKFYTPVCGEVEFGKIIEEDNFPIQLKTDTIWHTFTKEGYYSKIGTPECLLFPSKDQRDWNVWEQEQDKKKACLFKIGDHVIDNRDNTINIITRVIDKDNVEARLIEGNISMHLTTANLTKIDKYPIECFKPFDRVLVRNQDEVDDDFGEYNYTWNVDIYSYYKKIDLEHICIGGQFLHCIPYNEETKHLVGTADKAPEFYINWEEE